MAQEAAAREGLHGRGNWIAAPSSNALNCGRNSVSIGLMYDPDDHKIIRKLLDQIGESESLRLGFLDRDDNATLFVSPKGLGYLLDVLAAELVSLPEAYAAGYDQGYTQAKDGF